MLLPLASAISARAADDANVRAITPSTAALAPGQSGWLSVVWTADTTVTDWSTTVTAPEGITVAYPATRGGSDTSLYGSSTLVGSTRDFTAFKLIVPYTVTSDFTVTLTSTFVDDQGNQSNGNGNKFTTSATVTVPVRPASGPQFTKYTSTISVKAGSDRFQQIWFQGGTTDLANFTVALGSLPAGLQVAYPGDKNSSALSGGTTLVGGDTDYVAIRFNTVGLQAGSYDIPLTINFTAAAAVTASGKVTLVVS
jgi:hypothetical protein